MPAVAVVVVARVLEFCCGESGDIGSKWSFIDGSSSLSVFTAVVLAVVAVLAAFCFDPLSLGLWWLRFVLLLGLLFLCFSVTVPVFVPTVFSSLGAADKAVFLFFLGGADVDEEVKEAAATVAAAVDVDDDGGGGGGGVATVVVVEDDFDDPLLWVDIIAWTVRSSMLKSAYSGFSFRSRLPTSLSFFRRSNFRV